MNLTSLDIKNYHHRYLKQVLWNIICLDIHGLHLPHKFRFWCLATMHTMLDEAT